MRTENSIKNISVALSGQLLASVMSFLCRTVFVYTLSSEYLGVSGLFSNILSMLSLAELGVGNAIIFSMYKPIAEGNELILKQLLCFYGKVYRIVGTIIGIIGLLIVPFLGFFIKDMPDIPHLRFIYILYLGNTVITYFYIYKSSVLDANQQQYIGNIYRYKYLIFCDIIQMVILLVTHNFILYLVLQVLCSVYTNWKISKKAEEMYPWIPEAKNAGPLNNELKIDIRKNILAMFNHNLGAVVVNGTDNILISKFAGLVSVGLYSNYYLILNSVIGLVSKISEAVTASVGNLGVLENEEKIYSVYKILGFVNFWVYSFCTICFWTLFNPFITIWIGSDYLLPDFVVLIICMNFYISGMRKVNITFRDALGLFWYDRYKPLAESAINLIASIFLAKRLGIAGVFIGTFISTVLTSFWVEPYILYKYKLHRKLLEYMIQYLLYAGCVILAGGVVGLVIQLVPVSGGAGIIWRLFLNFGIINGIYILIFFRTSEFQYLYCLVCSVINKTIKKIKK